MKSRLYLYEQIHLLSMKDDDGQPHTYNHLNLYTYVVAGAILMDLFVNGYLLVDKKQMCIPLDAKGTPEDSVLASVWQRIRKAKKPKTAKYWVMILATYEAPTRKALMRLVEKGIVEKVVTKFLFVFRKTRYPLRNHAAKHDIVRRLEDALAPETSADTQTIMLLGLIKSAKLLSNIFHEQFRRDPAALNAAIEAALQKKPLSNIVDEALDEDTRREHFADTLDISFDIFSMTSEMIDVLSDAVDSSIGDAGGGDGGDGGGGDGGGGSD